MISKDKMRKISRAAYFAKKMEEFNFDNHQKPCFWAMQICFTAQMVNEIKSTPWQVFRTDKPEIDKRREAAWHRANNPSGARKDVGVIQ